MTNIRPISQRSGRLTSAIGPRLSRSDRTEMGPLTEEQRPRIRAPAMRSAQPSLTQTGHARSQHFPEVALCYAVTRYPLPLGQRSLVSRPRFPATCVPKDSSPMTISLYKASAPIFVQFLTSLSAVLDKAA